jgi:MFS transporter, DHA1 family, multidrug resistance protein
VTQWKRTLLVTAVAQAFSILGFSFVTPFLPLFVQKLGIHGLGRVTLWAAILSGGSSIFMVIAAPVWGVLADRHGRKVMVARAAFSAALLIGLMSLVQNVYQLLALRLLQGAFTGTISASQALVSSQSPRDRMGFSLGVMQTAVFVGTSAGPLLGGFIADAVGFRLSFAVGAACLFIAGLLVAFFAREDRHSSEHHTVARPRFFTGMRETVMTPGFPAMVAAIFAVQFGVTVLYPVLPQFVQYLQGPAGHVAIATGLIFAASGFAGAISSIFVGFLSDRVGYKSVLVVATAAVAVLSVPQYFVTATWQLLVLRILIGFGMGAVLPSASALAGSLVPSEKRGTAYGLTGSATSLGFAFGPLTAAGVVSVAGLRPVFLTPALLFGVISLWIARIVRHPEKDLETGVEGSRRVNADVVHTSAHSMTRADPPSLARRDHDD